MRLKTDNRSSAGEKERIAGECTQLRKLLEKTKIGESEWADRVASLEEKLTTSATAVHNQKKTHESSLNQLLTEIEKQREMSSCAINDLEKES